MATGCQPSQSSISLCMCRHVHVHVHDCIHCICTCILTTDQQRPKKIDTYTVHVILYVYMCTSTVATCIACMDRHSGRGAVVAQTNNELTWLESLWELFFCSARTPGVCHGCRTGSALGSQHTLQAELHVHVYVHVHVHRVTISFFNCYAHVRVHMHFKSILHT